MNIISLFVCFLAYGGVSAIHPKYESIFNFGDSLSDTGNCLFPGASNFRYSGKLPYGRTFGHPTGRYSDGRLIIDFLAEALHLPLLSPYLKVADGQINIPGVNFAVAGASALDTNFFKGLPVTTNISLNVQLSWFKKWKSSFCANRQDCERYLNKSLFVVREIGGNDYNNGLFVGQGIENGKALVRTVVEDNTNATINLIEEGAVDLMVSGNLPIGCMLMFLTMFGSSNQSNYGKSTGCLKTFNALARYHNKKLRQSLEELRSKYPNSKIMYADYYRAAMKLYKDPKQHGFTGGALSACRGVGGPYNFNNSAKCGDTGSSGNPQIRDSLDSGGCTHDPYNHPLIGVANALSVESALYGLGSV
ncbi:hypothetical protein CRG98_006860 [Punica granatum]|uniref:GDSL esterase/lipase At5g45910-like n=1 Tax=Punica granatum TaxID=22663 RepID=A0A2I0KWC9_PUNGR|nr:hypothetical protein CRG98_006860 [Punica granatum]